jgi:hypothetical protein
MEFSKIVVFTWLFSTLIFHDGSHAAKDESILAKLYSDKTSVAGLVLSVLNDKEFLSMNKYKQLRIVMIMHDLVGKYLRRKFAIKKKNNFKSSEINRMKR